MKIDWCTVGAFQENSYLIVDSSTRRAVLVDPGAEPQQIIQMVRASGATLDAIWLTHAHIDHIGAIAPVKRVWDVPIYMHPADKPLYDRGVIQAAAYGLSFEQPPDPDHDLAEGDVLNVGSLQFDVLHVPGHAPGHVAFVGGGQMLGGDLLFAGSIGRTDLPLSDPERMIESLERVAALPDDTVVYPGHGPATSIGRERVTNPFLTGVVRVVRR
ncbi:MAG TPA: MBL fold metallo-hydrolase [Gemmatimonadaceae bacterium]|nr:MBL fold metallo-hydrolase [Gemmatimonadaceae bacterium]